jgi:hypothetical protein
MNTVRMIDQFYQPGTYDAYTFVFDEQDPRTGYYTMLALSEDGSSFSQWTEGLYTPGEANEHLGRRVARDELGQAVLTAVDARLGESEGGEQPPTATDLPSREELA